MTEADRQEFDKLMHMLFGLYNRVAEPAFVLAWWNFLAEYDIALVRRAMNDSTRRDSKELPVAPEIKRAIVSMSKYEKTQGLLAEMKGGKN